MTTGARPLDGVRVIELGQLLAGPFTATILGYFGAEVIKVEPPGGDPVRGWRIIRDGTSLWYRSLGRNKKSVTLDLKSERGRELVLQLLDTADVLVENFRPGAMEAWGLGDCAGIRWCRCHPGTLRHHRDRYCAHQYLPL